MLVGFTEGKVREEFFSFFEEMIDFICSIRVAGEPNPENAEIIANKIININNSCKDDISDAINFLSQRSKKSCRIIICGSLLFS